MRTNCEICNKPLDGTHWKRCIACMKCDGCGITESLCSYVDGVRCQPCEYARNRELIRTFKGRTDFTGSIVCPWCGDVYSDSFEYDEGEMNCQRCGNLFDMSRCVEVSYTTSKAKARKKS
ncbi:MAG TPA: hypothetical protein VNQ76_15300 [Planctomicrobium sp.]|nr:hypothetical protein [Planctomicrobium sp.]